MDRRWPALDVHSTDEILLAALDDFSPTAIDERGDRMRVFFASSDYRNAARAQLTALGISATAVDVPDDDWAVRSQQNLAPITIGRITVIPDPRALSPANPQPLIPNPLSIVIPPSMGFGTGHHATTRLCLAAMQALDLRGSVLLDVGTGSGILAIAADRLGAARTYAIDFDPDAIQSADENLSLNPPVGHVTFAVADLTSDPLPTADVVTANLTGATLSRWAPVLLGALGPGGTLVASGILEAEETTVCQALSSAAVVERRQEDEWLCLILKKQ